MHSTYTVRNRTAHRVHLKCHDAEERYDGEELVVVEPDASQALFWPRDISPVLRKGAAVSHKSRKWCRPVALSKEEAASYQIHMKCGPYLHVCVVTHDRLDAERVEIQIRPKHIIHNQLGRPLRLWRCGMIDRAADQVPIAALDADAIVTVPDGEFVNIAQWRMEFEDSRSNRASSRTSSPRHPHHHPTATRVVSAAVRVTFDCKDDVGHGNAHERNSNSNHWEWSKQIFIPNSMSRGRRHVMVNNQLYGFEDLVSFVTLLHRSVVHTVFFRCGQPPCLIRNETSHVLLLILADARRRRRRQCDGRAAARAPDCAVSGLCV